MRYVALALAFAATVLGWSVLAAADGGYGRLQGDMGVQADIGAGMDDGRSGAVGSLSVRYLQTAGAYNTWYLRPDDDRSIWTTSFGVELRPLFLPRFFKNMQSGPAVVDLMLDSIGLRLGAVTASDGPFSRHGLGFEAGLGIGVPLTSEVSGPWLSTSGSMRWAHDDMGGFHAGQGRTFFWTVTLGWQEIFRLGLVDIGDTKP